MTATVDALHQSAGYVEVRTDVRPDLPVPTRYCLPRVALASAKHLLPRPLKITVHARTIVLMEVNATEVARLHGMPSLIYKPRDAAGTVTSSHLSSIPMANTI